jgi:hypothetical protein
MMALELDIVAAQIDEMAESLKAKNVQRKANLNFAMNTMHAVADEFDRLRQKIDTSKTSWLIAGIKERINKSETAISCPRDYIVLATDGSHIDVDRHHSAHCFLINIGLVQMRYGQSPEASLSSLPLLYYRDDEVMVSSSNGMQYPVEGSLLALKRTIEECRLLVEKAVEIEYDVPVLALLDGSLILWGIMGQAYQDFAIDEFLSRGFLKYLGKLHELNRKRQLALASYISFPRSRDVVNALRLAICPHELVNCDHYCPGKFEGRECDAVADLLDRDIFDILLKPGERSAVFGSCSSMVEKHYGVHATHFFYIKVNDEIARVEIPLWVAEDNNLLDLAHVMILEQCRLGLGYPVVLAEAHEKAVITAADREQFWRLVEQILAEDRTVLKSSAKQQSKRARWI